WNPVAARGSCNILGCTSTTSPAVLHGCEFVRSSESSAGTWVSQCTPVYPGGQLHEPPAHVPPFWHTLPHAPQLFPSVLVFTHTPPQRVCPTGHGHRFAVQTELAPWNTPPPVSHAGCCTSAVHA